jgi:hypothetical protein
MTQVPAFEIRLELSLQLFAGPLVLRAGSWGHVQLSLQKLVLTAVGRKSGEVVVDEGLLQA